MRRLRALCALSPLCLLSLPGPGQESHSARTSAQLGRLQSRLRELAEAFPISSTRSNRCVRRSK